MLTFLPSVIPTEPALSSGVSIISDQMQEEEVTYLGNKNKERNWYKKRAGHILVPGAWGQGCDVLRWHQVNTWGTGTSSPLCSSVPEGEAAGFLGGQLGWGLLLCVGLPCFFYKVQIMFGGHHFSLGMIVLLKESPIFSI